MSGMRARLVARYLLICSCTVLLLLLCCHYLMFPVLIRDRKRSAESAYLFLQESDLSSLRTKSDEIVEKLIESGFHYIIFDESFQCILSDAGPEETERKTEWLKGEAERFEENATAVYDPDLFGKQVILFGKLHFGGNLYYVSLNKHLGSLESQIAATTRNSAWICVIMLIISSLEIALILKATDRPVNAITTEIKKLRAGDYSARIHPEEMSLMPPVREVAGEINEIGEKLNNYKSAVENYSYLFQNVDTGALTDDHKQETNIAMITHQLKTPLAIISSQIELAQDETDQEKRNYYYNSVLEEIDKLSNLISGILRNIREKDGGVRLNLKRICISELLAELVPKYENWLRSFGISFSSDIESGIMIIADAMDIEQAVHNYMMNACKHTKPGRKIRLTLRRDGERCLISVYNDGDGVPEEDIEKIWMSYFQGRQENGSMEFGLGLYIVRQIMLRHEGECYVVNREGGVEFFLSMPAVGT